MPDEAVTASTSRRSWSAKRVAVMYLVVLPTILGAGYVLVWFSAYLGGSYVVGASDLEACIAIGQRQGGHDLAGLTWTPREIPEAERARVVHDRWLFGLVERWTATGTVEAIGTRDGRERVRVAVEPGPLGIGWAMSRISYPPPTQ